FFFSSRRRHTRSKRDWSSDVCSSDLSIEGVGSVIPSLVRGNYRGKLHILTTNSCEDFALESLERLDEDVDLLLIEHSPGNLEAIMAAAAQRNAKGIIVVASSRNPNLSASDSRELVLTARDF